MKTATVMAAIGFEPVYGLKAALKSPAPSKILGPGNSTRKTGKTKIIPSASPQRKHQSKDNYEEAQVKRNINITAVNNTQSRIPKPSGITKSKGPGRRTVDSRFTGLKKQPTPSEIQKVTPSKFGKELDTTLADADGYTLIDAKDYFRPFKFSKKQKTEIKSKNFCGDDLKQEIDQALAALEAEKATALMKYFLFHFIVQERKVDLRQDQDFVARWETLKALKVITADENLLTYVKNHPSQVDVVAAFTYQSDLLRYLKENPLQLPKVVALTEEQDLWQYLFNNISDLPTALGISQTGHGVNVSDIQWFNLLKPCFEKSYLDPHSDDDLLYLTIPAFSRQLPQGSFKYLKEHPAKISYYVSLYRQRRMNAISPHFRLMALA